MMMSGEGEKMYKGTMDCWVKIAKVKLFKRYELGIKLSLGELFDWKKLFRIIGIRFGLMF